jgi:hypothetical protein
VDVFEQRVIDQRLVVSAASLIYGDPKEFDYRVVEANRDLGLSRSGLHHGATPGAREINVTVFFS